MQQPDPKPVQAGIDKATELILCDRLRSLAECHRETTKALKQLAERPKEAGEMWLRGNGDLAEIGR